MLGEIGSFAGFFRFPARKYRDPVLVSGTDGVGTKVKVAAAIVRGSQRSLLFCRTKRMADTLELALRREGIMAAALHGGHPVYFCIFTTHPTRTQTLAVPAAASHSSI